MQISRRELEEYARTIDQIGSNARASLELRLGEILTSFRPDMPENEWKALREELMDALFDTRSYWADVAAAAAAEFYDGTVGARGGLSRAQLHAVTDRKKTDDCVRSLAKYLFDGDHLKFISKVCDNAEHHVKFAANDTILFNSARDGKKGVRYARVPTSANPCAFCVMLAGRGFVYHTKKTAGEYSHYHIHCRCKVIAGFDGDTVEGYDPEKYQEIYVQAINELYDEGIRQGSEDFLKVLIKKMEEILDYDVEDEVEL